MGEPPAVVDGRAGRNTWGEAQTPPQGREEKRGLVVAAKLVELGIAFGEQQYLRKEPCLLPRHWLAVLLGGTVDQVVDLLRVHPVKMNQPHLQGIARARPIFHRHFAARLWKDRGAE